MTEEPEGAVEQLCHGPLCNCLVEEEEGGKKSANATIVLCAPMSVAHYLSVASVLPLFA